MMSKILSLILALVVTGTVGPALANPKVHSEGGSLVIEGDSRKSNSSEDTLYELLGREVQVYIFNHQTRVWPQVTVRSGPSSWKFRSAMPRDPRLNDLIQKYSQQNGVDPGLVRAVIRHESGFNPGAVSPKGAQGLMQLMPGTAALMGVRDPFDPEQNIAGGVGYLRHCLERFAHNVPLAVAAYNAGPARVAQCGTVPPIQETQAFVSNVMSTYAGQSSKPVAAAIANPPDAASVPTRKASRPAALQPDVSQDTPRRPRPKIIEVRSQ